MDLEKLTTSQVVLLTLLVSFVTSIATGIVTVALMEQAPPAVTQTVNRVVERTIEKVSPEAQTATAATVQQPMRESDIFAKAVQTIAPSVVRLYAPGKDATGNDMRVFVGHALVMDASGVLIADAGTPDGDGKLTALRSDGVEVPVVVIARPTGANMIRLQAATTVGEKKESITWVPLTLATTKPVLGRSVIAISGYTSTRVARGIITGISDAKDHTQGFVETDIPADSFAAGSPLIDTNGAVIAVATRESRTAQTGGFLATSDIVLQNKDSEGTTSP